MVSDALQSFGCLLVVLLLISIPLWIVALGERMDKKGMTRLGGRLRKIGKWCFAIVAVLVAGDLLFVLYLVMG